MSRLAYPAEARVWLGLAIALPVGAAMWLAAALIIWRLL